LCGKTSSFLKYICLINQTGIAFNPSLFQSPRVATYVTWRCVLVNHVKLISTTHTTQFVDTEKNNQKDETVKTPEITEDYNKFMQGMDRADHIFYYYPCCRKIVK
jgi:hypothetical protein